MCILSLKLGLISLSWDMIFGKEGMVSKLMNWVKKEGRGGGRVHGVWAFGILEFGCKKCHCCQFMLPGL